MSTRAVSLTKGPVLSKTTEPTIRPKTGSASMRGLCLPPTLMSRVDIITATLPNRSAMMCKYTPRMLLLQELGAHSPEE